MEKNAVIRITKPAHEALVKLAKANRKTVLAAASDAILSAKDDADAERQKLRLELEELRAELRKMTTRKDLAALFYSLAKGAGNDVKKERLAIGYRMLLGHEVNVDFASVELENK